ncbi:unnamed protein product [Mytilus coruscus]|uniref:Endonuclease/exonuclease/phosphatase domain-containing protein n=1 Tax=Mytilus coruscus TaxID=42192 RepID=A0A6J8ACS9_MYTCO|nr:unnamed protein product [Mytilus coruscus]
MDNRTVIEIRSYVSYKMNSIDEIKCAVSSVDFKLSEMKGDVNKLSKRVLDLLMVGDLFTYVADEALSCRNNPEAGTNDYGTKLLNLCKISGLRIINGRHPDGLSNDFIYSGPRGMSIIDYLLAKANNLGKVLKFITSNFTTNSDHAPLHVQFKTDFSMQSNVINSNLVDGEEFQFFKWNSEFRDLCYNTLVVNADDLSSIKDNMDILSQEGMDLCVNNFTQCLKNVTAPFFKQMPKVKSKLKRNCQTQRINTDKPWFDQKCKERYADYCKRLHTFNRKKTYNSHIDLNSAKKSYKNYELCKLKKDNPRKFYSLFKKKK